MFVLLQAGMARIVTFVTASTTVGLCPWHYSSLSVARRRHVHIQISARRYPRRARIFSEDKRGQFAVTAPSPSGAAAHAAGATIDNP